MRFVFPILILMTCLTACAINPIPTPAADVAASMPDAGQWVPGETMGAEDTGTPEEDAVAPAPDAAEPADTTPDAADDALDCDDAFDACGPSPDALLPDDISY